MKTSNKFFQYLLRSPELYAITLIKIWEKFDDGNFVEGKCEWLKLFPCRFNIARSVKLDLWANEEDLFVSRPYSTLGTSFTSTCPSPHCPSGVKQISSRAITLRYCTCFVSVHVLIGLYACHHPSVGYTGLTALPALISPFILLLFMCNRV